MQLIWRHHKLFRNFYTRLVPRLARCIHHLPDCQSDRVPFMWLIFYSVSNIDFHFIIYPTRFACISWCRLQGNTSRAVGWEFKEEGIGIRTKFLNKTLL